MRSGFVSIIGRPNVGKSTLINAIINRKVAITSNVSGTTRNIIQGIYNDSDSQIVFVDTPGIHKPINRLGKVLNKEALASSKDVDLILFVVDVASGIGKGDMFILDNLKGSSVPVILVLNKIDEKINLLGVSSRVSTLTFLNIRLITMIVLGIVVFVSFDYGYVYVPFVMIIYYILFEKIFLNRKIIAWKRRFY